MGRVATGVMPNVTMENHVTVRLDKCDIEDMVACGGTWQLDVDDSVDSVRVGLAKDAVEYLDDELVVDHLKMGGE